MRRPAGRSDFPDCPTCPYLSPGHWSTCFPCAYEQLAEIRDPCPICAQELRGEPCRNRLCTGDAGPRYVDGIEAITLHQAPLDRVVSRYKYQGKIGWAIIFARLLTGHLNLEWSPDDVDLIIANPPGPSRDHTTRVLQIAAWADLDDRWPFDVPPDTTIIKGSDTPRSAGQTFAGKKEAAREHARALQLRHPDHIDGMRVVVYDDICTTGLQLNRVAQRLREWGAASVHGIVLARQPWR